MLLTLIVFLVILSILVLGHELGHYLMAKKTGVKVEEFGFGYPPRLFGKKIGETIYSINWLPFGGFVKILGEDEPERKLTKKEKKRAFFGKPKRVRAAILVAGVTVNVLIAILAFTLVYSRMGIPTKTGQVKIVEVLDGSPAKDGGIEKDDIVLWAGGEEIKTSEKFIALVAQEAGEQIHLIIRRGEEKYETAVVPRENPPEEQGPLGIVITDTEMKFYPLWLMPFYAGWYGIKEALGWAVMVVLGVKMMLWELITKGALPKGIAGPVGILQITSGVARSGFLQTVQFLGVLSINLAVINILPFPALDGGRLLFIGFEAVFGRKVKPKIEKWLHLVGFALLITLIALVTINDIIRVIEPLGIVQKLKSYF
jgi:regulator of sigma E protease